MNGLKKAAIAIIFICGIMCLIPIIFYISNFGHNHFATETDSWGVFGDFIGGTLNPIIGLLNLTLLAFISFYVAKNDNHRQLNEFRYLGLIDLRKYFENTDDNSKSLNELKETIKFYTFNNQFLFLEEKNVIFNKLISELSASIDRLYKIRREYELKVMKGEIIEKEIGGEVEEELTQMLQGLPFKETEESIAIQKFSESKQNILGYIQTVMTEGDIQKYR